MSDNPYGTPPQGPYGQAPQSGWGQPPDVQAGASGYAFGPFAPGAEQPGGSDPAQPGPPPPRYPGRYAGPPPARPQPPRGRRTLFIVGAAALALIMLGVGTALVAIKLRQTGTTESGGLAASSGPTSSGSATAAPGPADAVRGYLTALSLGDADKALSYGMNDPAETSMLTDKVLAAARKRAPLTVIDVPAVEGQDSAIVRASYKIGKTPITESFNVIKQGEEWKLERVAAEVELSLVRTESVPLLINGTKVSKSAVNLFPGSYTFSTGLRYVDYGAKPSILIKTPSAFPNASQLAVRVNAKGKRAAVAAVKKSYSKCLKSDNAAPPRCPNRWTSNAAKWRNGTVDWKQRGADPFKKAKVVVSGIYAQVTIPLRVELSGTCTQGGRTGRCVGATITGTSIAVTSLQTNKPKVRWV
jgi:hypothetical protein